MARKQFVEIRFDATEKVTARNSTIGGTVVGDLVSEGVRTLIVKMPQVTAPKKKSTRGQVVNANPKSKQTTTAAAAIRPSAALAAAAVAPEA